MKFDSTLKRWDTVSVRFDDVNTQPLFSGNVSNVAAFETTFSASTNNIGVWLERQNWPVGVNVNVMVEVSETGTDPWELYLAFDTTGDVILNTDGSVIHPQASTSRGPGTTNNTRKYRVSVTPSQAIDTQIDLRV